VLGDRGVYGEFRRGEKSDNMDQEFWETENPMHLGRELQ
jgi:hypothetical protein